MVETWYLTETKQLGLIGNWKVLASGREARETQDMEQRRRKTFLENGKGKTKMRNKKTSRGGRFL